MVDTLKLLFTLVWVTKWNKNEHTKNKRTKKNTNHKKNNTEN